MKEKSGFPGVFSVLALPPDYLLIQMVHPKLFIKELLFEHYIRHIFDHFDISVDEQRFETWMCILLRTFGVLCGVIVYQSFPVCCFSE